MITFFRSPVRNPHPEYQMNTSQVYSYITNPSMAERKTRELRNITEHDIRQHYKSKMFDYVTFSGQFTYRSSSNFVGHTGLFCFDFDHLQSFEEYIALRRQLLNDPYLRTILLFRSPSGDGLKWIAESPIYQDLGLSPNIYIPKQNVVENHKKIYANLAIYIEQRYKVKPDKTSDVSRACYLPYDPDCFHQFPLGIPQPDNYTKILKLCKPKEKQIPVHKKQYGQYGQCGQYGQADIYTDNYATIENIVRRIEQRHIDLTADYNQWVKIAFAIAGSVGAMGSSLFHRISQFHPRYDYDQTERLYSSCLKNANGKVSIGTLIYLIKDVL